MKHEWILYDVYIIDEASHDRVIGFILRQNLKVNVSRFWQGGTH